MPWWPTHVYTLPIYAILSTLRLSQSVSSAPGYDLWPGDVVALHGKRLTLAWHSTLSPSATTRCNWQHRDDDGALWERFLVYNNAEMQRQNLTARGEAWWFTNTSFPCKGGLSTALVAPPSEYNGMYRMVTTDTHARDYNSRAKVNVVQGLDMHYSVGVNNVNVTPNILEPSPLLLPPLVVFLRDHVTIHVTLLDNFPNSNVTILQNGLEVIWCKDEVECHGYVTFDKLATEGQVMIQIDPSIQGTKGIQVVQTFAISLRHGVVLPFLAALICFLCVLLCIPLVCLLIRRRHIMHHPRHEMGRPRHEMGRQHMSDRNIKHEVISYFQCWSGHDPPGPGSRVTLDDSGEPLKSAPHGTGLLNLRPHPEHSALIQKELDTFKKFLPEIEYVLRSQQSFLTRLNFHIFQPQWRKLCELRDSIRSLVGSIEKLQHNIVKSCQELLDIETSAKYKEYRRIEANAEIQKGSLKDLQDQSLLDQLDLCTSLHAEITEYKRVAAADLDTVRGEVEEEQIPDYTNEAPPDVSSLLKTIEDELVKYPSLWKVGKSQVMVNLTQAQTLVAEDLENQEIERKYNQVEKRVREMADPYEKLVEQYNNIEFSVSALHNAYNREMNTRRVDNYF